MENKIENTTIKMVKYPFETIEYILKYINETAWEKSDILSTYSFINDLRNILNRGGTIFEEEMASPDIKEPEIEVEPTE